MAKSHRLLLSIIAYCFFIVISVFSGRVVFADDANKQVNAQDAIPKNIEELKIAIEKIRVESGLPGLGIAIVDSNGPIWVAGLGEADKATHKPATQDTLFRIGSTSKMFVALSVLQLVEQGKVNLNDKLSDLAPEIYYENPWEKTHPIRLVNLLEHTTGWDDLSFKVYSHQDANITLKDALDFYPQYRKSRWVPGTRYAYNNAGPAVAAYIVSKISGQLYEDYVQEHFFNPLQMTSSTFFEDSLFKQRGATLYSADEKVQPYWHILMRPAGSLNSSASDMANYLQFLIGRGVFNHQALLSASSFTRMETPTSTLGAKLGLTAGYGLHNYVTGYKNEGFAFRGHDGALSGGHCILNYLPELNVGFVLLINQDNLKAHGEIPNLIRAYLLKDAKKAKPAEIALPEKFQNLSGYYIELNPRKELSRFIGEVLGVMSYKIKDNHLHREPLLGGWAAPSNDVATSENILTNLWSGLPTIAFVQDPIEGEVLETADGLGGTLYKKVSAFRVFGLLGWIGLTVLLSAGSIVFALIWSIRLARGNIAKGSSIAVRVWPLITSLVIFLAMFAPNIFQTTVESMGTVSPTNLVIFFSTSLMPLLAIYSLFVLVKHRHASINKYVYWYSAVLSILHTGLVMCFAYYGLIGVRMWA